MSGRAIRTWNGDSRGRWEGNTLVVDITNYNDKGSVATNVATQRVRAIPQSEELHVVERFTRVDENTINYEAIIEDPKVFTAPWKVAIAADTGSRTTRSSSTRVTRGTTRSPTRSARAARATGPRRAAATR